MHSTTNTKTSSLTAHESGRLPCLDGLRGVAVGMVLISHGWPQTGLHLSEWMATIVYAWGGQGVELFFGLSGYLITHLLLKEHEAQGSIDLSAFYLRRALRILPPLLLFLGTVSALNLTGVLQVPWGDILAGLFFFRNYLITGGTGTDSWYVGHLWSLSMEEQFYLLLPFALAWFGPKKMRNIILVFALAMPLIRVGSYFLFPSARTLIGVMFHSTADRLLWGGLLALYGNNWKPLKQISLFRSKTAFWAIVGAFLFILPLLGENGGAPYTFIAGMTIRSLVIVFIIAWLGQNPNSLPAKFLNLRGLKILGLLSYSIYLWQQLFIGQRPELFNGLFPLAVAACLGAGLVSYLVAEAPFMGLRKRLRGHQKRSAHALPAPARPIARPQPSIATAK